MLVFKPYLFAHLTKFRFGRPKLCRDWKHENESKNFGIFEEILGFLGSLLRICTKLQLAMLNNYTFLKQGKIENTGFLLCRYLLRIIFLKFSQINNNIPYLLAAQKKSFVFLNFCTQAT